MKYMLDTNICIYAQKQNPEVIRHIQKNLNHGLVISAITHAELMHGVEKSVNYDKNLYSLIKFLSLVSVLPFDSKAAVQYGKIRAALERKGTPIGPLDMLIYMSTREKAFYIFNQLTDEQLDAFITLFSGSFPVIEEVEPDEWDEAMIQDSLIDNEESMPLDDFIKELGFDPDDL